MIEWLQNFWNLDLTANFKLFHAAMQRKRMNINPWPSTHEEAVAVRKAWCNLSEMSDLSEVTLAVCNLILGEIGEVGRFDRVKSSEVCPFVPILNSQFEKHVLLAEKAGFLKVMDVRNAGHEFRLCVSFPRDAKVLAPADWQGRTGDNNDGEARAMRIAKARRSAREGISSTERMSARLAGNAGAARAWRPRTTRAMLAIADRPSPPSTAGMRSGRPDAT